MEHERRLAVDLDELREILLLLADVDERVAVVVEDAEVAIDTDVDGRGLQQLLVVGVDLDPALCEHPCDRPVREHHRGDSTGDRALRYRRRRASCASCRVQSPLSLVVGSRRHPLTRGAPGVVGRRARLAGSPVARVPATALPVARAPLSVRAPSLANPVPVAWMLFVLLI